MSGWRRSISYNAVVPHLGWPTTKKSGTLVATGAPAAGSSVERVIAPQGYQITIQVLAERNHLWTVATAQLTHEALVGRLRPTEDDALSQCAKGVTSQSPGRERRDGRLDCSRGRPAA